MNSLSSSGLVESLVLELGYQQFQEIVLPQSPRALLAFFREGLVEALDLDLRLEQVLVVHRKWDIH